MAQNTTDEQEFTKLQRHPQYYLNGGDIHFLADNQLFRVHRYFFERESRVFREQIELPTSPGRPHQGEEESVAIVLDVPAIDFEKLLGVFYNPRYSLYDWIGEDWTSILELAHKWEFDEVKNLAIRELEKQKIPLLTRIILYQRFKVDHALLVPLYAELCSRAEALDEDESEALGIKTTVLIFTARERLRAQPSDGGRSPLPSGLEREDVHNAIRMLLGSTAPVTSPTENQSGEIPGASGCLVMGSSTVILPINRADEYSHQVHPAAKAKATMVCRPQLADPVRTQTEEPVDMLDLPKSDVSREIVLVGKADTLVTQQLF